MTPSLRSVLRTAMRDRRIGYKELSIRLQTDGLVMEPAKLRKRIERGHFSGGFWLRCMSVMGVKEVKVQ